jgi:hypothetical protein
MQASRCRPVFQSTELRQTLIAHTAREPGVNSKKGKIGSSGKPRRRKAKLAVRMQYGALPYRFSQDAALEILLVTTRGTRRWIVPKGWPIKVSPPRSEALPSSSTNVNDNPTESNDLAKAMPDKLKDMQDLFYAEAKKNNVLPLETRRLRAGMRPARASPRAARPSPIWAN